MANAEQIRQTEVIKKCDSQLKKELGTGSSPLQVYNLTYSPRVHSSGGTAPRFSLAQPRQSVTSLPPRDLPGWLLVRIDSPTDVPTLQPRGTDKARRQPPPPVLPRTAVQSPGVANTIIADGSRCCPAFMCKPLTLQAGAEVPLQTHLPLSSIHANSRKFYLKHGAALLKTLLKRETHSAKPRGAESCNFVRQIYTKFRTDVFDQVHLRFRINAVLPYTHS